jgi:hypothetical protein
MLVSDLTAEISKRAGDLGGPRKFLYDRAFRHNRSGPSVSDVEGYGTRTTRPRAGAFFCPTDNFHSAGFAPAGECFGVPSGQRSPPSPGSLLPISF